MAVHGHPRQTRTTKQRETQKDGHVTPEELQFSLRNLGIHVRDELIDDLLREAT
ncbi:calcium-binding protein E63-1 [Culex quinquefasciatus]|uniref:Calcium-binding protein E63-1 n=1 Tax=Culex quinquefasciatus TaxID=7176 RepID=B0X8X8_CULQU|nr:calcium-binding protein E63-1 [Culex quinquefasciatus]|eukprot:XP_001866100.1 calcium-binding protein E63-1 [Culex quinquefasciatus]